MKVLDPNKPALNYQRVLSKSMTRESSRRTSCALPSKIPGAEPMAAGRNGGRAKSQPSRAAKVSTRHSTAGRMRAEGCTGTSGCPAAFPDAAARTRASVRRSRTPETHPTRCHTGRNEAVLTSDITGELLGRGGTAVLPRRSAALPPPRMGGPGAGRTGPALGRQVAGPGWVRGPARSSPF